MRFEALPGSPLPDQLRDTGYDVTVIGQTQRILPHAVVEELVAHADGSFGPVTEGYDAGDKARDACRDRDRGEIRSAHALTNVCCQENSGNHLLVGRISPFDPTRT
jgi:hypothetical protein